MLTAECGMSQECFTVMQRAHQASVQAAAAGYVSAEGGFIYAPPPPFHYPSAHTHASKIRGSSQGLSLGNVLPLFFRAVVSKVANKGAHAQ